MRVRFVSPWYPDYGRVHSGIFVAKQVQALRAGGDDITVEVPQVFPAPAGPIPLTVTASMRTLASRSPEALFATFDGVTYVPTPVPARSGILGRARAMAGSLSLLNEFVRESPELIHAHLGVPTAWAVSQAHPNLPLVVTEHQSTLATVFADPEATRAYVEVIRNAKVFICVSEHLRDQIVEGVGDWALQRIEVIPNIVDLTEIPLLSRPRPRFGSWIYVGGLMPHKGVQSLLKAFDFYVRTYDSSARLTLVGDGPLDRWVRDFASARGHAEAVELTGSLPHAEIGRHLADADVMVHLSPAETFGIAPLEAIGSGLPVVALRNAGAVGSWGDVAGESGLLLPVNASPKDVADAISKLRDSQDHLRPEVGRQLIEDRYSPLVVAQQLRRAYERALS